MTLNSKLVPQQSEKNGRHTEAHIANAAATNILKEEWWSTIFELPENFQPTKIGGFENSSTFYWVDSIGNPDQNTMYMG